MTRHPLVDAIPTHERARSLMLENGWEEKDPGREDRERWERGSWPDEDVVSLWDCGCFFAYSKGEERCDSRIDTEQGWEEFTEFVTQGER